MAKAYSLHQIFSTKYPTVEWSQPWVDAFDRPEATGVWFVWAESGNGKTSFIIQLALELSRWQKVFYNSLEEGNRLTMSKALLRVGADAKNKNFQVGKEPVAELRLRLLRRKAPKVVILDSAQYLHLRFEELLKLFEEFADVLFIITSHAEGKEPEGRVAKKIKYHADLKIRVEGYKAISNGRYNPGGEFIIWEAGAAKYWSQKQQANGKK